MAKVNTIANNGLSYRCRTTINCLNSSEKQRTIDDVRILVASVRDFIFCVLSV